MADEEKVNTLIAMFPDISLASARLLLKNTKGNVEQAVENILTGNIPTETEKKEERKLTQEEEDAILARQLQAQIEFVSKFKGRFQ